MALIVETGCWGCDSYGPQSLIRVYRDPAGQLREETILQVEALGYGPRELPAGGSGSAPPYINGFAADQKASVMVAGICIKLTCQPRGLDEWYADSVTAIIRSGDGGFTWHEIARAGPAVRVLGIVGDEALVANYQSPEGPPDFSLLPSNTPLKPPIDVGRNYPLAASGQLLWRTDDARLLLHDGTEFFAAPLGGDAYVQGVTGPFTATDKGSALVEWSSSALLVSPTTYVATIEMVAGGAVMDSTFSTERILSLGWYDPKNGRAMISIDSDDLDPFGPIPALLDLSTGQYQHISEFDTDEETFGRRIVNAVQLGPFARVVNTGSCLNIRLAPSLTAEIADCAADGVLLTDAGEATEADGVTWARVTTPAGFQGWASTAFLER
jgi:hypothetical protein